MQTDAHIKKDK